MKQLVLLLLLCLTLLQQGISQNAFPPAYEIVSDTISTITLPATNWQYAEDRAGTWTIDSVRQSPVADKFHSNTPENRGNNDPMFNYWIRFRLKNTMDREAHIALQFLVGFQSDIYLFESNGKEHHLVNGMSTPWSKKDGNSLKNPWVSGGYTPVSLLAGDEWVVYMRSNSKVGTGVMPSRLLIRLYSIEKMNAELRKDEDTNYIQSIKDSVFFGILLWVAIFNLWFFSIVKERVYLYFALYVFFLGFTRFFIPMLHLFFREQPSILFPSFYLFCLVFIVIFMTYFFRNLLKTYLYFPFLDKFLLIINVFMLIIRMAYLYFAPKLTPKGASIFWDITGTFSTIVWLSLLATLILFVRKRRESNRNMMFTLLPPFGTWVICWSTQNMLPRLNRIFDIPLPFFYNWLATNWPTIEIICLVWMVAYFSWVLLERFNELRKQVVQKELEKEIERSQLIAEQKDKLEIQVEERTHELKLSLDNLKSTQTQLIQSEKLASLGELTAGIAHEIQNPLNFVNNFSELSVDLAKELDEELDKDLIDKGLVKDILSDLTSNQEKINHHGKRASSIVKGMLEHSRASTGVKELTDINKLADEYLRLSYHGLRAKDKDFNANFNTEFDENLPKTEVIPQDIGRVLLNLINNAFYAVHQRQQLLESSQLSKSYTPSVSVTTQHFDNQIIIRVKDNGTGMPESVRAKVFQPFFTTKPTGQGTGLGLSLAYDIVTKGHGGSLEVESTEGVGTEFIIRLLNVL